MCPPRQGVEHRVGRTRSGPGRLQLGGADRANPLGVVASRRERLAGELVPAHDTLVRGVEDTRHPLDPELRDHRREVRDERRVADLVVDEADLSPALGEAQQGLDHVLAVLAADPRRAGDRPAVVDLELAAVLGPPVDRHRARSVPLGVGTDLRAVEHVVGRDVDDVRADPTGAVRDEPRRRAVHPVRELGLGLAAVDGGERRAVQHQVGPPGGEHAQHVVAVGQVVLGQVEPEHLVVTGGLEQCDELGAELSAGAGDDDPHRFFTRSSRGSHQSRRSR